MHRIQTEISPDKILLRTFIRLFPLIHSNKNTHGIQPIEDKEKKTMEQKDVDMLPERRKGKH